MRNTILILFTLLLSSINLQAKIYAVVVGVDKYDGSVSNLSSAVTDAERMYRFLKADKQNKVVLLTDKKATKQNILYAMEKTFAKAEEADMILFYFSGHGGKGMFCPTNVKFGRMGLLHTEIRNAFKASNATNKLCVADACYSGSIVNKSKSNSYPTTEVESSKENVVIFMSSRDDELSLESYLTNGGIFTRFFVKGMQGAADLNKDRGVSLHELYTYVRKHVRHGTDKQQTPIMYGNFNKDAIISYY